MIDQQPTRQNDMPQRHGTSSYRYRQRCAERQRGIGCASGNRERRRYGAARPSGVVDSGKGGEAAGVRDDEGAGRGEGGESGKAAGAAGSESAGSSMEANRV